MEIISGLRFVEKEIKVPSGHVGSRRILQRQLSVISLNFSGGTVEIISKPMGWEDVPMTEEQNGN